MGDQATTTARRPAGASAAPDVMATFRDYREESDRAAAERIWREVGWLGEGNAPSFDSAIKSGRALVAELDGDAECLVLTAPGTVRYLRAELPFGCVTGVTTSRVARRLGLAARLTARAIAADAADGAIVSGLGMFEQGFYNKLGFGTGTHHIRVIFDPGNLRVPRLTRAPKRLKIDDFEAVHANRLERRRGHGACSLTPPLISRSEMERYSHSFGLGYYDGPDGTLSHHVWMSVRGDVESGPYDIMWFACRTREQFLELLAVIESLGDQVRAVRLLETSWVQIQDFVEKPFQRLIVSKGNDFDTRSMAFAWWQMRINDVPACVDAMKLPGADARFQLRLTDPIERYLPDESPWRGVAGDYVVSLGTQSSAEPGTDGSLPVLEASVNAFTRIWLGVRPATGIAVSDDIQAPEALLEALDDAIRVPPPNPEWDY